MISRSVFTAMVALVTLAFSLPAMLFFSYRMAQEREREFLQSSEWMARNFADQVWLQLKEISPEEHNKIRNVMSTMVTEFVVMDPIIYAQVVLNGELVAQHHHLGDAPVEGVLSLSSPAQARRVERKRLEGGLEYVDLWRGIEPGRTEESVESYVRLGVSLAPLREAINAERGLAMLWGSGFILAFSILAYLSWPWWTRLLPAPSTVAASTDASLQPITPAPSLAARADGSEKSLRLGQLFIDDHAKEVRLNGSTLPLTPREYSLIYLLASEPGKVFSVQEIIERAWGTERFMSSEDVKKYIYLLRQKIERDPQHPQVILTVRGFGYKLVPPSQ
jgi:DNA-binding winged helix-turn-helix (wHTH) protein